MFTGIIETTGHVKSLETNGSNISFWIEAPLVAQLRVDQSLSHNGVCLTVEAIDGDIYKVTAIEETLTKTNLGRLRESMEVNLERCMQMNGRLDGHIVQGHVDGTATCVAINQKEGSTEFSFQFDEKFAALVIEKGSITINGISLTIFNVLNNEFTVAIIPYTMEHTNMKHLQKNDVVNIEFDMIGKYVNRIHQLQ
ncbi:MAG: riboflavin synthase [Sphingobacteriales bacterium]|nr:MAG: riboflavin synthase [Sphingobacteriales bacterium]